MDDTAARAHREAIVAGLAHLGPPRLHLTQGQRSKIVAAISLRSARLRRRQRLLRLGLVLAASGGVVSALALLTGLWPLVAAAFACTAVTAGCLAVVYRTDH